MNMAYLEFLRMSQTNRIVSKVFWTFSNFRVMSKLSVLKYCVLSFKGSFCKWCFDKFIVLNSEGDNNRGIFVCGQGN